MHVIWVNPYWLILLFSEPLPVLLCRRSFDFCSSGTGSWLIAAIDREPGTWGCSFPFSFGRKRSLSCVSNKVVEVLSSFFSQNALKAEKSQARGKGHMVVLLSLGETGEVKLIWKLASSTSSRPACETFGCLSFQVRPKHLKQQENRILPNAWEANKPRTTMMIL